MEHSPAEILAQALVDLGAAVLPPMTGDWIAHIGSTPDSPDKVLTLTNTTGYDEGRLQFSGEKVIRPAVQIRVRGIDHNDSWKKAAAIANLLDLILDKVVTIDGDSYSIDAVTRGSVIPVGMDVPSSKRYICSLNTSFTFTEI